MTVDATIDMDPLARYPDLISRAFNCPLTITAAKAKIILGVLAPRLGIEELAIHGRGEPRVLSAEQIAALPMRAADRARDRNRKVYNMAGDIAVIPVRGTLVQRNGLDPYSGMTGYDGIAAKFRTAMADPDARGVLLDIDSPGGEVSGLFDLVDEIHASRGDKPIWAVASEVAASAAFALASAADRIVAPRTGIVGSIGTITMHADFSKQLEGRGITVTLIHAGRHKADGNPYEPLPESVRDDIQSSVEAVNDILIETVGRNRDLDASAIREQEAQVYMGADGMSRGLVDELAAPSVALASMQEAIAPAIMVPTAAALRRLGLLSDQSDIAQQSKSKSVADHVSDTQEETEMTDKSEKPAANAEAGGSKAGAEASAAQGGEVVDITPQLDDAKKEGGAEATARATAIAELCALANLPGMTRDLIQSGVSVDKARAQIAEAKAAADDSLVTNSQLGADAQSSKVAADLDVAAIYAERNKHLSY